MATLEITHDALKTEGGLEYKLVKLVDSIDSSTVDKLLTELDAILTGTEVNAIFDMSEIVYVNSRGMSILIKYHDQLSKDGGKLILAEVGEKISSTFEVMGLLDTFNMADNLNAAISELDGSADTSETTEEEEAAPAALDLTFNCDSCMAELTADAVGKYRCPRCQNCFEVTSDGEIVNFTLVSAESVELTFPAQSAYVDVARAAAVSAAKALDIASFSVEALDRAVDEAMGIYAAKEIQDGIRLRMIVSAENKEVAVAFLATDSSLDITEADKTDFSYKGLESIVDSLTVTPIEPQGHVMKLVKRFDY